MGVSYERGTPAASSEACRLPRRVRLEAHTLLDHSTSSLESNREEEDAVAERGGNTVHGFIDVCTENGSRQ